MVDKKLKCETGEKRCFVCTDKKQCQEYSSITGESICYRCGTLYSDEESTVSDYCPVCRGEVEPEGVNYTPTVWLSKYKPIDLYLVLGVEKTEQYRTYLNSCTEASFILLKNAFNRILEIVEHDVKYFPFCSGYNLSKVFADIRVKLKNAFAELEDINWTGGSNKYARMNLFNLINEFFTNFEEIQPISEDADTNAIFSHFGQRVAYYENFYTKVEDFKSSIKSN